MELTVANMPRHMQLAARARRPSVHNAPYQALAAEVTRLRRASMSFRQIQAHLRQHRGQEVSVPTLERTWRFADPRAAQAAWKKDDHRALPPEKLRELQQLLNQGIHTSSEIARLLGVSKATVNRYRGYLQNPPWPGRDQGGYSPPTESPDRPSTTSTRATRSKRGKK